MTHTPMNDEMAERQTKRIWPLGGYAPGGYTCQCRDCGTDFVGDKRASQCLECAITSLRTRISDLERERDEAISGHAVANGLLTAAVDDYNDAIGEIRARSEAYEQACRERDEAREHYNKNLAQIAAIVAVCETHGFKDEALAAIRALQDKGEQG